MSLRANRLLEYSFAFVLASAAIFRAFSFSAAQQEFTAIGLPGFMAIIIIVIELALATMIIFNFKKRLALIVSLALMSIATVLVLLSDPITIAQNVGELFAFDPTPTDIALHLSYIIVIIALLMWNKK